MALSPYGAITSYAPVAFYYAIMAYVRLRSNIGIFAHDNSMVYVGVVAYLASFVDYRINAYENVFSNMCFFSEVASCSLNGWVANYCASAYNSVFAYGARSINDHVFFYCHVFLQFNIAHDFCSYVYRSFTNVPTPPFFAMPQHFGRLPLD